MPEYDNTNRGVLFKNDRKEEDTHADYRGNINIDGVEYWLDAWINTSEKVTGGKFMSLRAKPKEAQPERDSRERAEPAKSKSTTPKKGSDDLDDDIPF